MGIYEKIKAERSAFYFGKEVMRKRSKSIMFRLTGEEYERLEKQRLKTSLSREAYLRLLVTGNVPVESPPLAYYDLINQLRKIGTNLNQIAYKANALNKIETEDYMKNMFELQKVILKIMEGITQPQDGNDRNLESKR